MIVVTVCMLWQYLSQIEIECWRVSGIGSDSGEYGVLYFAS